VYVCTIGGVTIERFVFQEMDANCYAMLSGDQAVVIDPHGKNELFEFLDKHKIRQVLVLLTHEHPDHTYGIPRLQEKFECWVICHKACAEVLANARRNRPSLIALNIAQNNPDNPKEAVRRFLEEFHPYTVSADQTYDGALDVRWLDHVFTMTHAPGHSPGGSLITMDGKCVFSGDNLILNTPPILRFPESNARQYDAIVRPFLNSLSGDMLVLPGHGKECLLRDMKAFLMGG